jgi:hypothetical protein
MQDLLEKTEIISVVSILISSKVDNISVLQPGGYSQSDGKKACVFGERSSKHMG